MAFQWTPTVLLMLILMNDCTAKVDKWNTSDALLNGLLRRVFEDEMGECGVTVTADDDLTELEDVIHNRHSEYKVSVSAATSKQHKNEDAVAEEEAFIRNGHQFRHLTPTLRSEMWVTNCVVHVIIADNAVELEKKLLSLVGTVQVRPKADFFVFMIRDGDAKQLVRAMKTPLISSIFYKIGLIRHKSHIDIITSCTCCVRDDQMAIPVARHSHQNGLEYTFPPEYDFDGLYCRMRPKVGYTCRHNLFMEFCKRVCSDRVILSNIEEFTSEKAKQMIAEGRAAELTPTVRYADIIADKLNGTWDMIFPVDLPPDIISPTYPNGTWAGAVGDIYSGRVALIAHFPFSHGILHMGFYSDPVFTAAVTGVARAPKPVTQWKVVYLPFNVYVWVTILVSVVVSAVVLRFLGFARGRSLEDSDGLSVAYFLGILLRDLLEQCRRQYIPRSFVICWALFAIVIICVYKQELFTMLMSPPLATLPFSPADVIESGREVVAPLPFYLLYPAVAAGRETPDMQQIRENIAIVNTVEECLEECLGEEGKYCCTSDLIAEFALPEYIDRAGKPLLAFFDFAVFPTHFAPFVSVDAMISVHLHRMLRLMSSAGLQVQFVAGYKHVKMQKALTKLSEEEAPITSTDVKVLGLTDLQAPFFFLIIGLLLAILLFIGEVVCTRTPQFECRLLHEGIFCILISL